MNAIQPRRALIATHHLAGYAGSEVFTLELAAELREMGWEVCVAALLIGEPMMSEFNKRGLRIVDMLTESSVLSNAKFDLAWVHHSPVLYELLLRKIEAVTLVFCSLSHFEPLEAVPDCPDSVDLLLAHSIENKNHIVNSTGWSGHQVHVFPNAVPGSYWAHAKAASSPSLKRMAIISNHPPAELLQAAQALRKDGIEVAHIGAGGLQLLVDADFLCRYDTVVSIGKTVPYCLALKIPVYCYDHFGGPGWLHEGNLDLASQNNFSGRGFPQKTAQAIALEITGGYHESLGRLNRHATLAANTFDLRKNLALLLSRPEVSPGKKRADPDTMPALKQHAQYIRLAKLMRDREAEVEGLRKEISRVKSTLSWRLASPFRVARNFLRRIIGLRLHQQGKHLDSRPQK